MAVTLYTFQSPSPNQVQIGRPDPSTKETQTPKQEMKPLQDTQKQELVAAANPANLLDVYA